MKKLMNVLKKVTVVAVLCMLVANATTTKMYQSYSSIASQQLVSCSAYEVNVCAKDDTTDLPPIERPLGDLEHY